MEQILIVEDDSFLNKMLDYNLTADGYGVTSALNARTAAEAIRQREFDLVLLDINLPDGNGFELCKLIKPQHPDTIVIFLTVADGLFCREIDGLFCRSSPDIIVRRRCVLSHKRRGWLQPSPSFRYSRNLALQDELYHPVINNGPAVLVCVDKRLGTGPVNQSRDAG